MSQNRNLGLPTRVRLVSLSTSLKRITSEESTPGIQLSNAHPSPLVFGVLQVPEATVSKSRNRTVQKPNGMIRFSRKYQQTLWFQPRFLRWCEMEFVQPQLAVLWYRMKTTATRAVVCLFSPPAALLKLILADETCRQLTWITTSPLDVQKWEIQEGTGTGILPAEEGAQFVLRLRTLLVAVFNGTHFGGEVPLF